MRRKTRTTTTTKAASMRSRSRPLHLHLLRLPRHLPRHRLSLNQWYLLVLVAVVVWARCWSSRQFRRLC